MTHVGRMFEDVIEKEGREGREDYRMEHLEPLPQQKLLGLPL